MKLRSRLRPTIHSGATGRPDRRRLAAATAATAAATLLATCLATAAVAPAAADLYADKLDLVFLMDGSGSIDSSDWALQKQGYIEALDDPVTFPRDGSISISLVQWSWNGSAANTRVEIPLTVLDDESAVDALADDIAGIPQISASTNPGDAIKAGTDLLLADGRQNADWSLCMSTDGAINSGIGMNSAVAYAQSNSVDRYGVLAIEDGGFTEDYAHAAYDPYVFGGGKVAVARSTAEFATLISGCVNPKLRLEALEVTQGIQTLLNDVQLVEGRETIARAYVGTYGDDVARTSGRLRGYRDGVELPGSPIAPLNSEQAITAVSETTSRRSDRDGTLNFRLPEAWTTGEIVLEVEMGGGTGCDLTEYGRWTIDCGTAISFSESRPPINLEMVSVSWDNMDPETDPASFQDAVTQSHRSEAMFPIADINMNLDYLEVPDGWWDENEWVPFIGEYISVLDPLNSRAFYDNLTADALRDEKYYQGMLPGRRPDASGATGMAQLNSSAAWTGYAPNWTDGGGLRNVFPHELGHSLGLWHAVDDEAGPVNPFVKYGYCNEDAPEWAPDHEPFTFLGDGFKPTLGPIGIENSEVWGTDANTFSADASLAVSAPHDVYELMGYCDNDDPNNQGTWISHSTWDRLLDGELAPAFGAGPAATGTVSEADGIYVSGAYDATSDRAALMSVQPTNQTRAGDVSTGVQVKAYAADGSLLASSHALQSWHEAVDTGYGESLDAPAERPFGASLAVNPDQVARLTLVTDGQEVEAWSASGSAPQVAQPRAAVSADGSVRVSWSASDADADALRHTVFYSTDGGAHFRPIAVGISTPDTEFPAGALPGGDLVLRVVSSDGIRFGTAETSVRTRNSTPQVAITAPASEERFSAAQVVQFSAEVSDREDGPLAGGQVTWSSDRNGLLGTGTEVSRRADTLVEGWHTITVRATDSAGETGTATTRIFISRVPGMEPPPENRYGWGGVTSPLPADGPMQAGRTIPVKFTVTGETATEQAVLSAAFVRDGATYALVREDVRDDVGSYHVNVATPKVWAGSTVAFQVELTDGQVFTTDVAFR